MKLLYSHILLSIMVLVTTSIPSYACGAFERYYDDGWEPLYKFHFYQGDKIKWFSDMQADVNILLWRNLTNRSLPDSVIRKGVYKLPLDSLRAGLVTGRTTNRFIRWIYDNNATDLKEFLLLAKELEELRFNRVSAWYYPSDKSGFDQANDEMEKFQAIIEKCDKHKSGRLADRYALQAIRALMSVGEYQECIDYYSKVLAKYPDSNLFKRMAQGYLAGCYSRLGDTERADEIFALIGDFGSLSRKDKLEYMAVVNPESELFKSELNRHIGYCDSTHNMRFYNIADLALKSPKTVHRGDWLYLKAYIEKSYRNDSKEALRYLNRALTSSFSTPEMRKDARLMSISLKRYGENSVVDIKWMLDYGAGGKWERIIPDLLEKKDLTKALLIANYNSEPDTLHCDFHGNDWYTWANSGFQMLLSCKADEVIRYKYELDHPSMNLTSVLKPHIRHDSDYLNEIIGTLYLREGRYEFAVNYLSKVSFDYQRQMNIFREGYLFYNPWDYYYTHEDKWYHSGYKSSYDDSYDDWGWHYPHIVKSKLSYLESQVNAKLNFAKEMSRLERIMKLDKNENKRAMAGLRYAIGRYNSLNTCWAYTQYWVGGTNQCYYEVDCKYINDEGKKVDFIIPTPRELKGIDRWFENEVESALARMSDPETLAKAHLILRNYRTLAKHFPDTKAGMFIASRCDSWNDWL